MNSTATQRAEEKTVASDQPLEVADRLAIERGEEDGMIIHQDANSNIHNSKDLNDITTR